MSCLNRKIATKHLRIYIIIFFCGYSLISSAQTPSEQIRRGYLAMRDDLDYARNCIEQVSEDDVSYLSDSIQFMYHYCASNAGAKTKLSQKEHLLKVKDIMENRIGINSPAYLISLWNLGYICEKEENLDLAEIYYNTGYVRGMLLVRENQDPQVKLWYGQILFSLGKLKAEQGNKQEAEYLLLTSQSISKDFPQTNLFVLPLTMLAMYQTMWGDVEESIKSTVARENLILATKGEVCHDYIRALYDKAAYLKRNNQLPECIECNEHALALMEKNKHDLQDDNNLWEMIASNLMIAYADNDDADKLNKLIPKYIKSCNSTGNSEELFKTLYMSAEGLARLEDYKNAKLICEMIISKQLYATEEYKSAIIDLYEIIKSAIK